MRDLNKAMVLENKGKGKNAFTIKEGLVANLKKKQGDY